MTRLLVVDDDACVRETIRFILALEGYEVVIAESGPAAMAVLARETVDAVLLDLMMPGMDGYAVCREIRAVEGLASVPILILTARWQRDDLERAREAGAAAVFKKPLDEAALLAYLAELPPRP